MMPPTLSLGGLSDDEEEDGLGTLPASLSGTGTDAAKKMQESFMLSQSGTFKVQDFNIKKTGLVPAGLSDAADCSGLDGLPGVSINGIDDFETLNELGSGCSGTVFRARHKQSGAIYAVKQVTILEKPKRDQVVAELRIMRQHQCPWLVALHNAFYEEAKVYTVLEFMDAGSLADLCAKHAPNGGMTDEREMGKIATQMLNGLNYLHRQHHQVHRDLKPANVMLNSSGAVKISDFGISSQLDSTAAMCSTFVGTTCFMSPERLAGDPYSYSSDIWSFGLIMLELASGKYPYATDDQSYFKLLGMIMDNQPPSLPECVCSDAFAEFISLCLEKDAIRRPAAKLLLKHPWLRENKPNELLLSGMLEGMSLA